MREAIRLSQDKDAVPDQAVENVYTTMSELKVMLSDLEKAPKEWGPDMEQKIRKIRKQYGQNIPHTRDKDDLEKMKEEVDDLWYRVRDLWEEEGCDTCGQGGEDRKTEENA